MQRRRCGVRNHEDEHPTIFTSVCCPNDRVNVEVRDGEKDLLTSLLSFLSSLVLFCLPQFQCTSSS